MSASLKKIKAQVLRYLMCLVGGFFPVSKLFAAKVCV